MEAWKAKQKRADASPQRADFEREFGKHRVKDNADGSWGLTLHDRDDIKKAHQMQEGSRRLDVERGHELRAKKDGKREKMVRPDGRVVDIQNDMVDAVKGRLRPAGRNGGAPTVRFGLAEAFHGYERGPDGLYFVWNGGWEPTELWRNGAESPQRDPDGNVWVERLGEWALEDEVA